LWYKKGATGAETALDIADLANDEAAHADGDIAHINDGYYRVDLPDAAIPTIENEVTVVGGTVTGMVVLGTALVGVQPIGAPAGASVSADVLAIKNYVDDIGAAGAGLTAITGVQLAADQAVNVTKIGGFAATAPAGVAFPAAVGTSTYAGGAVASVTGSVGSVAAGGITASSIATGAIDADALAADAVDELWDEVVDGTITARQAVMAMLAFVGGLTDGAASTTVKFKRQDDATDAITMTVDSDGERSAVTFSLA
jgi:hypothetical protein